MPQSIKKVIYLYNQEELKRRFRHWHVEPLLNQAADLIDRCKQELKELNYLRTSELFLKIDLEYAEKEIQIEEARLDLFERESIIANKKQPKLSEIKDNMDKSHDYANSAAIQAQHLGPEIHNKDLQGKWTAHASLKQIELEHEINSKMLEWAESDKISFKEKLEQRKKILGIKKEQSKMFGPLDYTSQKQLVFEHLQRDYSDALDRTLVAKDGLNMIYGYEKEIDIPDEITIENLNSAVHELSKWIYNAIEWLIADAQIEQTFTKSISLKGLLNKDELDNFEDSKDRFLLHFRIPNSYFKTHYNVRLKGIGAYILGRAGIYPWTIELGVPEKAYYRRKNREDADINQEDVPTCLLGRVENRSSLRNFEICGAVSLLNVSPMGKEDVMAEKGMWTINIIKPTNQSESFNEISDIVIDLTLTGKPA